MRHLIVRARKRARPFRNEVALDLRAQSILSFADLDARLITQCRNYRWKQCQDLDLHWLPLRAATADEPVCTAGFVSFDGQNQDAVCVRRQSPS